MCGCEPFNAGDGWLPPREKEARPSSARPGPLRNVNEAGLELKPSEASWIGSRQLHWSWGFPRQNPSSSANECCETGLLFNFRVSVSCPQNGALTDLPTPRVPRFNELTSAENPLPAAGVLRIVAPAPAPAAAGRRQAWRASSFPHASSLSAFHHCLRHPNLKSKSKTSPTARRTNAAGLLS